ncbi:MAG: DUF1080 domain-containing protein [Candidatus Hydrogenedens sp.]|nr:DUF1080 domain-containing protein [Candidatus Hydrogenedentota bacterium]NLF57367.1 DUF1080 domain-containing protein [Candidatus Hydrogenedens sp.]
MMKRVFRLAILVAVPILSGAAFGEEGFVPLFDGKSLDGWRAADPSYWSVRDGAVTGTITKSHPCDTNQYLVWEGGEIADFELKLESRVRGQGGINNGFQYRSRELPDHDVCGYQVDNNLETPWLVRLYDEYGRHTMAMRGEHAVYDAEGNRAAAPLAEAAGDAWFKLEDWHEYHLVCVGGEITLNVDGRLAATVSDNDPRRREPQGILALQLHSGPPTVAQFRNIRLKVLRPAEPAAPTRQNPQRRALLDAATAWWPLDTGGHGALPPLRHIPAFEQFELNVCGAGNGARPGEKVVVMSGAYFDAGPELHGGKEAVTVFLRARDPKGAWNGGLFAKRGGHDRVHFNLFSADVDGDGGGDIGFEVRTEQGFAMVSFPVSEMDATAWHELAGRYDGKSLEIFCDGRRMAGKDWGGELVRNTEPLLIAAETDGGNVVRHFHGELAEAALWDRALDDVEIGLLSKE